MRSSLSDVVPPNGMQGLEKASCQLPVPGSQFVHDGELSKRSYGKHRMQFIVALRWRNVRNSFSSFFPGRHRNSLNVSMRELPQVAEAHRSAAAVYRPSAIGMKKFA